jgi:hypothetical protein
MMRFDLKAITFFDEDEHLMSILSPDYTITYFPLYFRAEGVRIALELTKQNWVNQVIPKGLEWDQMENKGPNGLLPFLKEKG